MMRGIDLRGAVICLLVAIGDLTCEARQGDALRWLMKSKRMSDHSAEKVDELSASKVESSEEIIVPQEGSKEKDLIEKLPGQPGEANFKQYAGYITVNKPSGRALFYYFVEAAGEAYRSKPLLLWLNGGPGCSSFGYGAMTEIGPFRVMRDGRTLFRNPYAWNNVANVLFVESPAGVGFSYSNTTSDYRLNGDRRTADDAHVFLVNWFERFPEYRNKNFYIAGESYAGHYVPQLAQTILRRNGWAEKTTFINLRGIAVGNAVLNDGTDATGMLDFFWTHALISDETINRVHRSCNDSGNATLIMECNRGMMDAQRQIEAIDLYNIYAPRCHPSSRTHHTGSATVERFDPCSDQYVMRYLNLPEVQTALHANTTGLKYPWSACSSGKWGDSPSTVLPLLVDLLANQVRVWVYSGDVDGRIPVTSTRYSLNVLNLNVKDQWRPWFSNKEVGGYVEVYTNNLTFLTVRGAGHEVPSYEPQRSLTLIHHFLNGIPLSDK